MRFRNELLRDLRLRADMKQAALASDLGVNERTLRRYERGEIIPTWPTRDAQQGRFLVALATAMGLPDPLSLFDAGQKSASGSATARPPFPDGPYRADAYVPRPAEEAAVRTRLAALVPAALLGPQGYGKATLLHHMLVGAPGPVLHANLARLPAQAYESRDAFCVALGRALLASTGHADLERRLFRSFRREGDGKRRLLHLLYQIQEEAQGQPITLALERAEDPILLGHTDRAQEFYGLLRGMAEQAHDGSMPGLRLLLTLAAEPVLLETGNHSSLFALATPIALPRMSSAQFEALAQHHGRPAEEGLALEGPTGGGPYLAALALAESARSGVSVHTLLPRVFAAHLDGLRGFAISRGLWPLLLRAVGPEPPRLGIDLDLLQYGLLYSRGLLLSDEQGRCRPSCPLYHDYLDMQARTTTHHLASKVR